MGSSSSKQTPPLALLAAGAVAGVSAAALYVRASSKAASPKKDVTGLSAKFCVVLGGQWGDEGKGKLVDILAETAKWCVRFNGGANAGHTLVVEGKKYAFHLLPCGMIRKDCTNVIGNGTVVHVPTLLGELEALNGFDPDAIKRLRISNRAHVLLDAHREIDGLLEAEKQGKAIGTTKRGIGPCYASKANRNGLRFADLLDGDAALETKYNELIEFQKIHYGAALDKIDVKKNLAELRKYAAKIKHCIVDTVSLVQGAIARGERVLAEGANAALLDLDFGTYPFVTSSSTTAGGVCTGLGVAPRQIGCVIGVVKAYTTRVGAGPFPTELLDATGERLRSVGGEFGTTTGRPRRCGWLDIPLVKFAHALNGYDSINVTKLDVLTGLPTIEIGAKYLVDGVALPDSYMPASLAELAKVKVEYVTMPGWSEDLSQCTSFDELPANAQAYLRKMEELAGVPISWVGVGPDRKNMFLMPGLI